MARGTTLANVLLMVKGELAYTLTSGVATAQDQELYTLIDNQQQRLAGEWDWPFLKKDIDATLVAASRYVNLPALNFERPVSVNVLYNELWMPVKYGIGVDEYNAYSSGDNGVPVAPTTPTARWQVYSATQYEVWPVPDVQQVIRFTGQQALTSLKTTGVYDPAKTLDLDDLMVALFVVAFKSLRLKLPSAQLVMAEAQRRLTTVRSSYPQADTQLKLGRGGEFVQRRPTTFVVKVTP